MRWQPIIILAILLRISVVPMSVVAEEPSVDRVPRLRKVARSASGAGDCCGRYRALAFRIFAAWSPPGHGVRVGFFLTESRR